MTTTNKPTPLFWVVSVTLVLWNLMGASSFIIDNFFPDMIAAAYSEVQMNYIKGSPLWAKIFYGIATLGGLLAAVLLLMRKKLAVKMYFISLIALLIHTIYQVGISEAMSIFGIGEGLIFPLFIVVLAVFEYWFSKYTNMKGWLH